MSDLSPQRQSVLDEVARSAKSGPASWAKIRDTLFRASGTTWETAAGHLRELEKVGLVVVDRVKRNDSATWLVSLPQAKGAGAPPANPLSKGLAAIDRYYLDRAQAKRERKQARRLAEGR